jgi:hypothetical protein
MVNTYLKQIKETTVEDRILFNFLYCNLRKKHLRTRHTQIKIKRSQRVLHLYTALLSKLLQGNTRTLIQSPESHSGLYYDKGLHTLEMCFFRLRGAHRGPRYYNNLPNNFEESRIKLKKWEANRLGQYLAVIVLRLNLINTLVDSVLDDVRKINYSYDFTG